MSTGRLSVDEYVSAKLFENVVAEVLWLEKDGADVFHVGRSVKGGRERQSLQWCCGSPGHR